MSQKTIGQKVRAAREKAGMERVQLATKLGLSVVYTGGIERDAAVIISPETLKKLHKALPDLKLTDKEIELKNESSRLAAKNYRKQHAKKNLKNARKAAKPKKPTKKQAEAAAKNPQEVAPPKDAKELLSQVIAGKLSVEEAAKASQGGKAS